MLPTYLLWALIKGTSLTPAGLLLLASLWINCYSRDLACKVFKEQRVLLFRVLPTEFIPAPIHSRGAALTSPFLQQAQFPLLWLDYSCISVPSKCSSLIWFRSSPVAAGYKEDEAHGFSWKSMKAWFISFGSWIAVSLGGIYVYHITEALLQKVLSPIISIFYNVILKYSQKRQQFDYWNKLIFFLQKKTELPWTILCVFISCNWHIFFLLLYILYLIVDMLYGFSPRSPCQFGKSGLDPG